MYSFLKKHKWLLVIILVALLIRVIYFLYAKPWESGYLEQRIGKSDSEEYHTLAKMILEIGGFPENAYLDTYRTPVFPLYISLFYFLFGVKPYIILLSHIVLNLISIVYIFFLSEKIFSNSVISLIASGLYALEPNVIKLTTELGTETLHASLLILSVYYLITGLKDKKKSYISLSGILFAVTALTRPVSMYFYILCIIFIFFCVKDKYYVKFKFIILFVLFYLISITPWMYRNYKTYGHFSTNTFQGNALIYLAGITKHYKTGITNDSINSEFTSILNKICTEKNLSNPFDIDEQKQIVGLDYLRNNLDVYIPLHFKGMLKFFIAPLNNTKYSFSSKVFLFSYFFFIYAFFIFGIYGLVKKKYYIYSISFPMLIFYFWFLAGIIGRARYRLPVTAFMLIASAFGIYYSINFIKTLKFKN